MHEAQAPVSLIRLPEVMRRTTLSKRSIYLGMRQGTFPKARAVGERAVAWIASEVDAWIAGLGEPERDRPGLPPASRLS